MRHNKKGRKLGTDYSHTKAMKRSLVSALFLNDRIKTVESRAKEIRPQVDLSLIHISEYREYLSDRYGRYKMAFSGIHLNYSFGEALLRADYELTRTESPDAPATFEAYRDQFYVRLAENCVAYSWILTAVMAASPVMDSSFVEKGKIGGDLFQGLATVRLSLIHI